MSIRGKLVTASQEVGDTEEQVSRDLASSISPVAITLCIKFSDTWKLPIIHSFLCL